MYKQIVLHKEALTNNVIEAAIQSILDVSKEQNENVKSERK